MATAMAFGDADLEFMMNDVLGVDIVYGAQTTRGFKNEGDHIVNDAELGSVQVRATTVAIKTGSLTGLAEDAAITVDGESYRIRDPGKLDDGQLTMIELAKV